MNPRQQACFLQREDLPACLSQHKRRAPCAQAVCKELLGRRGCARVLCLRRGAASMALRGKEGVGQPQPWGATRHRAFPTSQGPSAEGKLWDEGHFLPGVFLFSLPNRKLAPEEAEMLPFDPQEPGPR